MTPEHRKYLSYNAEDFSKWAKTVGENTEKVVTYFLTAGKEAEQGFKACASLTKLGEKHGHKKLEQACEKLLSYTSAPSIRLISALLKSSHTDKETASVKDYTNAYGITRGAAYYSKNGKDGEAK